MDGLGISRYPFSCHFYALNICVCQVTEESKEGISLYPLALSLDCCEAIYQQFKIILFTTALWKPLEIILGVKCTGEVVTS